MTATEAAAALKEAELQRHRDCDREDLADDERGPVELAEWARIAQLLATTGRVYDPDTDAVVQDGLAAEAKARAAAEAELRDLELEQERQTKAHTWAWALTARSASFTTAFTRAVCSTKRSPSQQTPLRGH
jgi:hypothetical protein